jgi:hypothetical protein
MFRADWRPRPRRKTQPTAAAGGVHVATTSIRQAAAVIPEGPPGSDYVIPRDLFD